MHCKWVLDDDYMKPGASEQIEPVGRNVGEGGIGGGSRQIDPSNTNAPPPPPAYHHPACHRPACHHPAHHHPAYPPPAYHHHHRHHGIMIIIINIIITEPSSTYASPPPAHIIIEQDWTIESSLHCTTNCSSLLNVCTVDQNQKQNENHAQHNALTWTMCICTLRFALYISAQPRDWCIYVHIIIEWLKSNIRHFKSEICTLGPRVLLSIWFQRIVSPRNETKACQSEQI